MERARGRQAAGWPNKSSQSVPCPDCRATLFRLMSLRSEYIWAIFRHRHRRSEAHKREVAF